MNLIKIAKDYFTDDLITQLSNHYKEPTTIVASGINQTLATLLGVMIAKVKNKSSAAEIYQFITKPEFSGGLLKNIPELFASETNTKIVTGIGSELLQSMMGGQEESVLSKLSSSSGMSTDSLQLISTKLLPVLLSVLGKRVKTDGLGLDAFMNLLEGQQSHVQKALPEKWGAELFSTLGLSIEAEAEKEVIEGESIMENQEEHTESIDEVENETNESMKKSLVARVLPIVVSVMAIVFAWYFGLRNQNNTKDENALQEEQTEIKDKQVDSSLQILSANNLYQQGDELIGKSIEGYEELGVFMKRQLPDGTMIVVPSNGSESKLIEYIEKEEYSEQWIELERIRFETNSATLIQESSTQLNHLWAILESYPGVQLKIGGYTDNTGNEDNNMELSTNRANAIRQELVNLGTDAERLQAEGYGSQHAIADNETEQGRAKNRRIAIRVTQIK